MSRTSRRSSTEPWSLRCKVLSQGPEGHVAVTGFRGVVFRLRLTLALPCEELTLFGFRVQHGTHITLEQVPGSHLHPHHAPKHEDLLQVIELCAGIGAGTQGAAAAGFTVAAAAEIRPPLAQLLAANCQGHVVQGDINTPYTIQQVARAAPKAKVLSAGVSCQPYSAGGDRRSGADERAWTLAGALQAASLLGSHLIVLECVKEAAKDTYVQKAVEQYCILHDTCCTQQVLELAHVWPSKRCRWWCVISAKWIGSVTLCDLPNRDQHCVVCQVIPRSLTWPVEEESQLELTPYELRNFRDYSQGLDALELKADQIAPTALHSWGNQVYGCRCGCRSQGFSLARMEQRGPH